MNVQTESVPSEQASRQVTMTLEEALAYGIRRHQENDLEQAETIYELVLGRHPDRIDVVNYLGILKHQRGDPEGALALMRRVVEHSPEADGAWNNLGNVLLALGRDEDAAEAFTRSIDLVETPQAWTNLASAWRRRGELDRSERACRRALELAPDNGQAHANLALALLCQSCFDEGVQAALKAIEVLPLRDQRNNVYARMLLEAGERERAAAVLRAWLARDPGNPYVEHQLVACLGESAPERASDSYVEMLFDNFASTFDSTLAQVKYCMPERVAEALAGVLPAPARQLDVADLGCGTGLCGPLLQPWARRLVGCDLSAAMLARARARDVYDDLEQGAFDLIVSADTLIYFGALQRVAHASRHALRPGGHLAFTVEAMASSEPGDHVLRATGRYAHSADYLRRVLVEAGLRVDSLVGTVVREESFRPVHGWIVTGRRVD
jgi:predicted TPR repeat methyltransferase